MLAPHHETDKLMMGNKELAAVVNQLAQLWLAIGF